MKFVEEVKDSVKKSREGFRAYPVSILSLVLLFILKIVNIETGEDIRSLEYFIKCLTLFIPLSLFIRRLVVERMEGESIREGLFYLLAIIGIFLYYKFILIEDRSIESIRLLGLNLIFYLSFIWVKKLEEEDFSAYAIETCKDLIMTAIYSLVLFLGLVFIVFSLDSLFNLKIEGKLYLYIFYFIGLIFYPLLALSRLSEERDYSNYKYPKSLRGIFTYIIIPLATVYVSILYLYFLKIIVSREFPRGLVSNLVIWYSLVVMASIFFLDALKNKKGLTDKFTSLMPILLLPILGMMFISMSIRIGQHGLTESRYLVLILGIWILGISLYLIFRKEASMRFMPFFLSLILSISFIGPFSAISLSKKSQMARMEKILLENNMLDESGLVKNKNLSREDKVEISGIIDYFYDKHSLDDLGFLPAGFTIENMEDSFGFEYTSYYGNNNYMGLYLNQGYILNLADYDYEVDFESYKSQSLEKDGLSFKFEDETNLLSIKRGDNLLIEQDMEELARAVYEKNKDRVDLSQLSLEDMSYEIKEDKLDIKIVFKNLEYYKDEEKLTGLAFKLYFKEVE